MTDTDNPWADPSFAEWAAHVRTEMFPKMESSALNVVLLPAADADVKLSVEIGYGILLDKPIIVVALPGVTISHKLRLVADEIIHTDLDDPELSARQIQEAVARLEARGLLPSKS